jgi:hypothetical protein
MTTALCASTVFFLPHSTDTDIHTHTSDHPYEYTHVHHTSMSIIKRLGRLDLEIYEVGQRASHY